MYEQARSVNEPTLPNAIMISSQAKLRAISDLEIVLSINVIVATAWKIHRVEYVATAELATTRPESLSMVP